MIADMGAVHGIYLRVHHVHVLRGLGVPLVVWCNFVPAHGFGSSVVIACDYIPCYTAASHVVQGSPSSSE